MAFAKGTESKEAANIVRYIGVAPVFIKAVNPSKKEYEDIFQTTLAEDPKYVTDVTDADGNTYKNARISIILMPDAEKIGFNMSYQRLDLFVRNCPRYNKDKSKAQIIDKYGRSAWASIEDIKAKKVPLDKNGNPLNIDADYKVALIGQVELTNFIKTYLGIPDIHIYDNVARKWIQNPRVNPADCICEFEHLESIFKGNFYEVKEALSYQPTNRVKVMFGIRTDFVTGREYQQIYTGLFLKNSSTSYISFQKEINNMETQAALKGQSLRVKYSADPIKEYTVVPTVITPTEVPIPTPVSDNPLGAPENSEFPWDV